MTLRDLKKMVESMQLHSLKLNKLDTEVILFAETKEGEAVQLDELIASINGNCIQLFMQNKEKEETIETFASGGGCYHAMMKHEGLYYTVNSECFDELVIYRDNEFQDFIKSYTYDDLGKTDRKIYNKMAKQLFNDFPNATYLIDSELFIKDFVDLL